MLMSASMAICNAIDNFSSNIRILFVNYYFFLDSLGINEWEPWQHTGYQTERWLARSAQNSQWMPLMSHTLGVSMGQVESGSGRVTLFYYFSWPNPNPTRLNSDQKILTHTRPDGSRIDLTDLCKIIKYLLIIFI
jgi:hypothetical protein